MAEKKILIIIPAFNEQGNIERTIREVRAVPLPLDILVIDDGSSDQTAALARAAGARVIVLPLNLGIGGAVQTGLQFARARAYDVAVQVDGDGQHDPRYLPQILSPVWDSGQDLVIGSRFVKPLLGYQSSFLRRIGIRFFARLISFLTGCPVTDPTSGFRAFSANSIRVFSDEYPQDFPEPESIVLARREGLKVREIPVKMNERLSGASSIRYLRTLYYMIKVTFAILLLLVKKNRKDK